ncbi:MAG TPA: DUF6644 family protein [Gammaproteobacteria bacterium]|nr:DUF6644 family protein [Gammaproteobacteria bacterium]
MAALLAWLQGSPLGELMRSSGVWAYGVVNLVHILSVATLFGAVLILDLRLLGVWRRVPLAALEQPTIPLAVAGFCCAAVSGLCLVTTNATEYAGNPFVPIKFAAIALGLLNVAIVARLPAWRGRHADPLPPRHRGTLAVAGGVSLACWVGAAAAGRLIGYW